MVISCVCAAVCAESLLFAEGLTDVSLPVSPSLQGGRSGPCKDVDKSVSRWKLIAEMVGKVIV